MNLTATITGIEYKIYLSEDLETIELTDFDINNCPASCLIKNDKNLVALSKWVSPKRTRSYPYERVYNTLSASKKITVIPVVKDEGAGGDRDFIQWDTVSLMSLLDVYVIFAFYKTAQKHRTRKNKITVQSFDNDYILSKINDIESYHSSALHWNLKEISENLSIIIDKAKTAYKSIAKELSISFHNEKGLDELKSKLSADVNDFMSFSRKKAMQAQNREIKTTQPKELLQTSTKATLTISNYLGGEYFLTADEVIIKDNVINLIESKHTRNGMLPAKSDIKDGLMKMILFSNLKNLTAERKIPHKAVLQLTSSQIKFPIDSSAIQSDIDVFATKHQLSEKQKKLLETLFKEANTNQFTVNIQKG